VRSDADHGLGDVALGGRLGDRSIILEHDVSDHGVSEPNDRLGELDAPLANRLERVGRRRRLTYDELGRVGQRQRRERREVSPDS
jgi:YD repeat-containing protein